MPEDMAFNESDRAAVYRAHQARRMSAARFIDRPLPDEVLQRDFLPRSAQCSVCSARWQPLRFIVIRDLASPRTAVE